MSIMNVIIRDRASNIFVLLCHIFVNVLFFINIRQYIDGLRKVKIKIYVR